MWMNPGQFHSARQWSRAITAIYLWGKVKGAEGLWRSDDTGANWVRINDDAHRYGELRAIAGDMVEPGTVYLAPHGRGVIVGRPAGQGN